MSPLIVFGDAESTLEKYPGQEEWEIDEEAGEWVKCPNCKSNDAIMAFWGGTDFDFACDQCDYTTCIR